MITMNLSRPGKPANEGLFGSMSIANISTAKMTMYRMMVINMPIL